MYGIVRTSVLHAMNISLQRFTAIDVSKRSIYFQIVSEKDVGF